MLGSAMTGAQIAVGLLFVIGCLVLAVAIAVIFANVLRAVLPA